MYIYIYKIFYVVHLGMELKSQTTIQIVIFCIYFLLIQLSID